MNEEQLARLAYVTYQAETSIQRDPGDETKLKPGEADQIIQARLDAARADYWDRWERQPAHFQAAWLATVQAVMREM